MSTHHHQSTDRQQTVNGRSTDRQQPVTTAGTTNDLDSPTGQRPCKEFETLRAGYALQGHALHRTDHPDGEATYWAERWGVVQHLPTIDAVRHYLECIGGRL